MASAAAPIATLLLVGIIGFCVAKAKLLSPAEFAGLGRFLVLCAVPALLFGAVSRASLAGFTDYAFALVFATSGLFAGVFCYVICSAVLDRPAVECVTLALGSTFPNSIAIGFPLAQQLFGADIVPLFALAVIVETLVFLPLGLLVLEAVSSGGESDGSISVRLARRILMNPILLAIIAGLCVTASPITLPSAAYEAVDLLGSSVAAVALFFAGGLIARSDLSLAGSATLVACAAKLAIAPAAAALIAIYLIPDQPIIAAAVVVFAAAPTLSSLSAISVPYGTERIAANLQGLSSTLALLTIPAVALLLSTHPGL